MEFLEIGEDRKDDWNKFILENSPQSFLQSFEWGEFQSSVGRKVMRFAIVEGERLMAVASVLEHKLPLGFRYWYLPRGPIAIVEAGQAEQSAILDFCIKALKEKARGAGIVFMRMDPGIEKKEKSVLEKLDMISISGSVQPKDTLVLDLQKSEEEMLSAMKPKTRYNVRLAEKKGVEISSTMFEAKSFDDFWKLIGETSERDGIVSHSKVYYQKMLEALGADGDLKCFLYLARYEGQAIAANIVLIFGTYAVYLHGASSNANRNLMAPYLLQWRQIRDARAAGCRIYDFWGITVDNAQPKWAGITRFKQGFGGREVSYAGVYDMPIRRSLYGLYMMLRKG